MSMRSAFARGTKFVDKVISYDETWIFQYYPETTYPSFPSIIIISGCSVKMPVVEGNPSSE